MDLRQIICPQINYLFDPHLTLINFAKGGALELVRHPKKKAIDMIVNETYTDKDLLR